MVATKDRKSDQTLTSSIEEAVKTVSLHETTKKKKKEKQKRADQNEAAENVGNERDDRVSVKDAFALRNVSGGNLSHLPVLFTSDSRNFICAMSSSILVYRVGTGEIVRVLSRADPDNLASIRDNYVTGMQFNPKNKFQLFSTSIDGTISLWDFHDAILLKTWKIKNKILSAKMHVDDANIMFLLTKRADKEDKVQSLVKVTLKPDDVWIETLVTREEIRSFDISADSKLFCAVLDKKTVTVGHADKSDGDFASYSNHKKINVVKFHPSDKLIAIGDEFGQINLWYYDNGRVTTKLHWHANPLSAIAFSPEGHYLLSGGAEGVLVIWQLATGSKQFVSQLGSAISTITISPEDDMFLLTFKDNSIKIISSVSLDITQFVNGLAYSESVLEFGHSLLKHNSGGLVVDPKTKSIVLNGVPGSLQFWDSRRNRSICDSEVSPRPRVRHNDAGMVLGSLVERVAFSPDGEWMATVDKPSFSDERYLKFWSFNHFTRSYDLATKIDAPHTNDIIALEFHPTRTETPLCVTASLDKTFKLWTLTEPMEKRISIGGKDNVPVTYRSWICHSNGFWRDAIPTAISFSEDGSILAIAFGNIITLWDPETLIVYTTISCGSIHDPIKMLQFGKSIKEKDCSKARGHLLAICTASRFTVYDLAKSCAVWSLENIAVNQMIIEPRSGLLILTAKIRKKGSKKYSKRETTLLGIDLFNASTQFSQIIDDGIQAIQSIPSFELNKNEEESKSLLSKFDLILMNSSHELLIWSQSKQEESKTSNNTELTVHQKKLFSSLFATTQGNQPVVAHDTIVSPAEDMLSVLDTASHMIPPVSSLFEKLLDSFALLTPSIDPEPIEVEADDDQSENNSDDEQYVIEGAEEDQEEVYDSPIIFSVPPVSKNVAKKKDAFSYLEACFSSLAS